MIIRELYNTLDHNTELLTAPAGAVFFHFDRAII